MSKKLKILLAIMSAMLPMAANALGLGEIKLNPWRDGLQNLVFLAKKRFLR